MSVESSPALCWDSSRLCIIRENIELISYQVAFMISWSAVEIHQPGRLCVTLTPRRWTDVIKTWKRPSILITLKDNTKLECLFHIALFIVSPCHARSIRTMKRQGSTAGYMYLGTFAKLSFVSFFWKVALFCPSFYVSKGWENVLHRHAYPFGWDLHCCNWSRDLYGETIYFWLSFQQMKMKYTETLAEEKKRIYYGGGGEGHA